MWIYMVTVHFLTICFTKFPTTSWNLECSRTKSNRLVSWIVCSCPSSEAETLSKSYLFQYLYSWDEIAGPGGLSGTCQSEHSVKTKICFPLRKKSVRYFIVSVEASDSYLVSGLFSAYKNTAHLLFLRLQKA